MKHLIEGIARSIVLDESTLDVEVEEGSYQTTLKVRAASSDVGKLVGKRGKTISAIRTLLDLAAEKSGELMFYNVWVEGTPSMSLAAK